MTQMRQGQLLSSRHCRTDGQSPADLNNVPLQPRFTYIKLAIASLDGQTRGKGSDPHYMSQEAATLTASRRHLVF